MIDYTGQCAHHSLTPVVAAYVTENQDVPGAWLYSAHMAVSCADCGVRFQFLGNNPLAPATAIEAQRDRLGAWVTGDLRELACMMAPLEPSAGLAETAVAGRA